VVAVAWSFFFILGGAMGINVAVPGALGVSIGVWLLHVIEGCDEHGVHLNLSGWGRGVMELDLYQRWSAA
jgi:hypothetical protein